MALSPATVTPSKISSTREGLLIAHHGILGAFKRQAARARDEEAHPPCRYVRLGSEKVCVCIKNK